MHLEILCGILVITSRLKTGSDPEVQTALLQVLGAMSIEREECWA